MADSNVRQKKIGFMFILRIGKFFGPMSTCNFTAYYEERLGNTIMTSGGGWNLTRNCRRIET